MFTSISAGVGDLPCFPTFFLRSLIKLKIPNFSLISVVSIVISKIVTKILLSMQSDLC